MKSVAKIHERHQQRLDTFSTIVNLTTLEGSRSVTRNIIVYNFKGLLEICRYSNQPKANDVMDLLWDIADEIRRTGSYNAHPYSAPVNIRAAEVLKNTVQYLSSSDEKRAFTREIYRLVTGQELPKKEPVHSPRIWTAHK